MLKYNFIMFLTANKIIILFCVKFCLRFSECSFLWYFYNCALKKIYFKLKLRKIKLEPLINIIVKGYRKIF